MMSSDSPVIQSEEEIKESVKFKMALACLILSLTALVGVWIGFVITIQVCKCSVTPPDTRPLNFFQGKDSFRFNYGLLILVLVLGDIAPFGILLWKRPVRIFAKKTISERLEVLMAALLSLRQRQADVSPAS